MYLLNRSVSKFFLSFPNFWKKSPSSSWTYSLTRSTELKLSALKNVLANLIRITFIMTVAFVKQRRKSFYSLRPHVLGRFSMNAYLLLVSDQLCYQNAVKLFLVKIQFFHWKVTKTFIHSYICSFTSYSFFWYVLDILGQWLSSIYILSNLLMKILTKNTNHLVSYDKIKTKNSWCYTTRRFLFLFESPSGGFCFYLIHQPEVFAFIWIILFHAFNSQIFLF